MTITVLSTNSAPLGNSTRSRIRCFHCIFKIPRSSNDSDDKHKAFNFLVENSNLENGTLRCLIFSRLLSISILPCSSRMVFPRAPTSMMTACQCIARSDDDDLDHTRAATAATAARSHQIGFILMHCREPPEEDYPKLDLSADERRRSRGREAQTEEGMWSKNHREHTHASGSQFWK